MKEQAYSPELRDKCLKEYEETRKLTAVARANNIPITTLRGWAIKKVKKVERAEKNRSSKKEMDHLNKELQKKDVEIAILKELLKKTNQAWLKD
jgi:hypothetical protein